MQTKLAQTLKMSYELFKGYICTWRVYSHKRSAAAEIGDNRHGPKGGGLGSRLIKHRWAEAHLRTKWHLDPSSCLATIDIS